MLVIKIGGPAYRIGMGGGAASSVPSGGSSRAELDFNAVQVCRLLFHSSTLDAVQLLLLAVSLLCFTAVQVLLSAIAPPKFLSVCWYAFCLTSAVKLRCQCTDHFISCVLLVIMNNTACAS